MSDRVIEVEAPSRLHFGLFSTGGGAGRQFGGVGAMIAKPGLRLQITSADKLKVLGPLADRIVEFARNWTAFHRLASPPPCQLQVLAAPPSHTGLGVGTQLGLSVATGLSAWLGLPMGSPEELAISVGRGQRSAVGTFGFALGGLIVERGKQPGERIAPLDTRIDLPAAWRFVLIRPQAVEGLSGRREQSAFACLPPVPANVSEELLAEVRERMVPAAALGDYGEFSSSIFRFGHRAGMCFASVQGGAYNGPRLTALVESVRAMGVRGVGQSSWGPTLFAVLADQATAEDFVARFRGEHADREIELTIAPPNNSGRRIISHARDPNAAQDLSAAVNGASSAMHTQP
jgi:beta-ribofuranosylaminobenzene 5'-phosphate synthase